MMEAEKMTKMSRAIMPSMANFRGILFGGMLMEWMDEVAGITAKRFAGCEVAAVAVEQIRFLKPVPVGAFVDVAGEVIKVGNTSLQIKICVVMDSQEEAEGVLAADALFVYVALDAEGKPGKVGNTSVLGGSCPDSGI